MSLPPDPRLAPYLILTPRGRVARRNSSFVPSSFVHRARLKARNAAALEDLVVGQVVAMSWWPVG